MKKILSLIFATALCLNLLACGSNGEPQETQPYTGLQAGFGRADISPKSPTGMGGYGDQDTRLSGDILDPIYATCIAFRENDKTFLVFTVDIISINDTFGNQLRSAVNKATGVPPEHMFIGATHTHSAPAWNAGTQSGCVEAAQNAIADLAPTTMETATTQLENMNFVRHYLMNDGTYYGSNFGSDVSGFKGHVMEPDKQLSLVKLERGEKKDILMVNWQAHPAAAARQADYNGVSADFVGYARDKVEKQTGMHMAYFTGAAGNLNPSSQIVEENTNKNGVYQEYGMILADRIIETVGTLAPVEGTGLQSTYSKFPVEVNHEWDHMAAQASEVRSLWRAQGVTAGNKLARQYGFSSVYHANALLNRASLKGQQYRELYAFSVGPVGFTTGTYEMFCDHAMYVKENSPFQMTFILTGCDGYIPNEAAFAYHSYEGDTCHFVSGTGEQLAQELVRMLGQLK